MSHFEPGVWVDSVRGLLSSERSSELQSHLDRHCPECIEAMAFWTRLAKLLARETTYRPPESLVLAIERLYLTHKPWQWLKAAARWADLVFDSLRQPSLAFVRGTAEYDRHLVYEATPFVIDVTLRTDASQNSLAMIGQILKPENQEGGMSEVYVVLLSGQDLVAKALANEVGEFAFQCEAHPDLSLFISIRGERAIGISLHDSTNGQIVSP